MKTSSVSIKTNKVIVYTVAYLIVASIAFPFFWAFLLSFKDNFEIFNHPASWPVHFDLGAYVKTFNQGHIIVLFKNSIMITIVSVFISMTINFFSSFMIARLNLKTRWFNSFYYVLLIAALAIPIFVKLQTIYELTLLIGKHFPGMGVDTLWALLPPYVTELVPMATLFYVSGMAGLPREMEEAGIIDGCSVWGVMFRIDFPLLMPITSALFIFSILQTWNEFFIASILLNRTEVFTIPMALSFFKQEFSTDYGSMMRAIIMLLIPQLVFFFIFQKRIVEGVVTEGLKG